MTGVKDKGDRFFASPEQDGRVKAKICGITTAADALAITAAGADAIGINFWPKSKRFISLGDASSWLAKLAGRVTRVGVFVNATRDELVRAAESGLLDALQLHGDEPVEFVELLLAAGLPVFKALGGKDGSLLEEAKAYPGVAGSVLLDAYAPVEYGGTGEVMDWALGRRVVDYFCDSETGLRRVILAGGLTAINVAEAIAQVRPFAVDVASGVEISPGRKDLDAVGRFLGEVEGSIIQ